MQTSQEIKPRLFFVDNLRTFLIALVFIVHLSIIYGSPVGSFYGFKAQASTAVDAVYVIFAAVVQAFFMGLLFLLSGYFTVPSYDRKGSKQFLKDRLIRLGVPLLIFALLIDLPIEYGLSVTRGWFHGSFIAFLSNPQFYAPVGPLWFVLALLFFVVAYVGWRALSPMSTKPRAFPRNSVILAFALLLGSATFVVRLMFPIGWNAPWLNFQLAFFAQYVALFIVGLIAFRSNWLVTISNKTGRFWSKIAVALAPILIVILLSGLMFGGSISLFFGGFNWQAAAYAFWEQLFAVAVCIGLTVWFRENINFRNRFTKALSESSYAAYILQVPVLIFLVIALQGLSLPLLLKWVVVSPIGVALCFAVAFLVRKIPKADKLF
jgi:peptidoglycan/LPS O-acetylase OafA/YrhL